MMRYYVEAFRPDGSQILGNLDGQTVLRTFSPSTSRHYKSLVSGEGRPKHPRVAFWRIVDDKGIVWSQVNNIHCATAKEQAQ